MQQARGRLRINHHSLTNISQELIAVQTQVADLEQSLFGKVLSLDAVKALYAEHEEVKVSNLQLRDDVGRLLAQLEGLSSQLATAQRGFISGGQRLKLEQNELRGQDIESGAKLSSLSFEASKGHGAAQKNKELKAVRGQLLDASTKVAKQGKLALEQLLEIRQAAKMESQRASQLEQEIRVAHEKSKSCRDREQKETAVVEQKRRLLPREHAASEVTLQHALAAAQAAEQRLQAEGAILREEIHRAENSSNHALLALQEAHVNIKLLEKNIVSEIDNITLRMNATKMDCAEVSKSISENKGAQTEDLIKRHALQVRVSTLQQQVSPVKFATLTSENEAFTQELTHAVDILEKSKKGEAIALVAWEQMDAEVSAQRDSSIEAAESVKEARNEGEKELEIANQEAEEQEAAARELEEKAALALGAVCQPEWDARKKETDEQLATCKQKKEELAIANAQVDTLKESLESQEAAAVASE